LDELVERHGLLQHRFDGLRGYDADTEIGIVLHALGFSTADAPRPVETFSGGWQMRIALGRLLLQRPDLLLLDEPTNHLDVAAVEWLEDYLRTYPGAIVMVSHDRYILDRVTTRTLELSKGEVEEYAANYSGFVVERERRREVQAQAYERQQALINRTQQWIDRFGAKNTKASLARSRAHMLERLERIEAPDAGSKHIGLRFDPAERSGRVVLEAVDVTRRFGPLTVLDGVNLTVERGDRIALVGPNGAGKSTLMRLLAQADAPDGGMIHRGHNVQAAYFAQHQAEALNPALTVLEELGDGSDLGQGQLRAILGRFLFSGDDAFKLVAVLSGGERSRLAFAKMLLQDVNLLLLDEPTNHLDIPSQEVLEQALLDFPGAMVLASHDRYLIDRIATKVVAVSDGGIQVHLGNYTQYRERVQQQTRAQEAAAVSAGAPALKRQPSPAQLRRESAAARKQVGDLEAEIASLEAAVAELAARLADPALYADHKQTQDTIARHEQGAQRLSALLSQWEQAAAAVL
jgi:ATP-binding cassette subfamily F protein 3